MDVLMYLERFAPEMIDLLERRYNILRIINEHQPIGRRMLADLLHLGERVVRGELEFLKAGQLLVSDANGVALTSECIALLPDLGELVHHLKGLISLENLLAEKMGLSKVFIVPGDVDQDHGVLTEMGKQTGRFIRESVQDDWVSGYTCWT